MIKQLMSGQDLAEHFHVSRRTIQRWTKDGTLPKPVYLGRTAYYHPAQINEFIDQQTRTHNDAYGGRIQGTAG